MRTVRDQETLACPTSANANAKSSVGADPIPHRGEAVIQKAGLHPRARLRRESRVRPEIRAAAVIRESRAASVLPVAETVTRVSHAVHRVRKSEGVVVLQRQQAPSLP